MLSAAGDERGAARVGGGVAAAVTGDRLERQSRQLHWAQALFSGSFARHAAWSASTWHVAEQPSLAVVLPSSHSSPVSTARLPHRGGQSSSLFALAFGHVGAALVAVARRGDRREGAARVAAAGAPHEHVVGARHGVAAGGRAVAVAQLAALGRAVRTARHAVVVVVGVGAVGQQLSPLRGWVMSVCVQTTLQFWALPVRWSVVHGLPSLQFAGQGVAVPFSQVSPRAGSNMPLPQLTGQSASWLRLHVSGQQPSPRLANR